MLALLNLCLVLLYPTILASSMKIAIVTGANKGIGLEIAKKLCQGGCKTIMACRNESLGENAAADLRKLGFDTEFRQLDISDESSIQNFVRGMQNDYSTVDILVNNAAIAFKGSDPTPFQLQAAPTMKPNYFGTLLLIEAMLPLLRLSASPRLVNVASMAGHLRTMKSKQLQQQFCSDSLTIPELSQLMRQFVIDVENGVHNDKGWSNSCYGMSKLAVIALTRILARQETHPTMRINCCCPGWCATDMSSHSGQRTAEQGARTPSMLALALADDGATGKFFSDEREVTW